LLTKEQPAAEVNDGKIDTVVTGYERERLFERG
jgi:hypothetical protein